ncbi:Phytochrome-like protein cph1 [Gemmata sp. SH-PL17]|nr:Phytochrome-like protein cph1 [Gemmata sp. SH-PL17]
MPGRGSGPDPPLSGTPDRERSRPARCGHHNRTLTDTVATTEARLLFLTGFVFVATIGYGTYTAHTLSVVKVNGPYYQRIDANNRLLADVMPPPLCAIEVYLCAHLMTRATVPDDRERQIDQYGRLKANYFESLEHWKGTLEDGPLKVQVAETSRESALAIFDAVDQKLIPALRRGDRATAIRVLEIELDPLFAAHRAAVDRAVALAIDTAHADETEVAHLVDTRQRVQLGLTGAFLASTTALALWVAVAVRRRATQFRAMIENSSEAVALLDRSAAALYHSAAVEHMLGYRPDELRGRRVLDLVHPDDAGAASGALGAALRSPRQAFRVEARLRHRDDTYRWAELVCTNQLDDPSVRAIVANVRDVTARRAAEARLRERDELLQKLTDQVPGALYQYRECPDGHRYFPFASVGLRAMLGVAPEEGRESADWGRYVHPGDHGAVRAAVEQSAAALTTLHVEYRVVLPDQGVRWRESRAVPEALPDGSTQWHGYLTDVTERKEWEVRQGNLVRELERRNAEMEQFTYTVSHDLKSPLVTIKGFAGVLGQSLAVGELGGAVGDLLRITTAADRMMALLDDLLDLSRVGRVGGPLVPVVLSEVLGEALERVSGPARAAGVLLRVSGSVCGVVLGDRGRLVEVFQNVLENGVKYGGGGVVEVSGVVASGRVVVSVRDWGIGIEPRHRERIFGLFEKLDPKSPGTGVGLALVKKVVEFHGGRVWVESAGPGTGSAFVIDLPGHDTHTEQQH